MEWLGVLLWFVLVLVICAIIRDSGGKQWLAIILATAIIGVPMMIARHFRENRYDEMSKKFDAAQFLKTGDLKEDISMSPRIRGRVLVLNVPPDGLSKQDASMLPMDEKWNAINKIEFLKLPVSLRATSSKDVRTVIFLRWNEDVVGKYTDDSAACKVSCEVVVIDSTTRTIVGRARFQGGEPSKTISTGFIRGSRIGSRPTREIVNYIKALPVADS